MTFSEWWEEYTGSDTDKSLELGRTYAKSAWNHLLAEMERERSQGNLGGQCTCTKDKEITCIVHPTTRSLKECIAALDAENRVLREAAQNVVDYAEAIDILAALLEDK